MKFLFLVTDFDIGGITSSLRNLTSALCGRLLGGESGTDLFADGPCAPAPIIKNNRIKNYESVRAIHIPSFGEK